MDGYTAEKKVTIMRNILTNRLGLYGNEFKTCLCPRPLHLIVNPFVPADTLMPVFPNLERTFFDTYIVTSKMNPFFHQCDK